jgi:hypothetical protein
VTPPTDPGRREVNRGRHLCEPTSSVTASSLRRGPGGAARCLILVLRHGWTPRRHVRHHGAPAPWVDAAVEEGVSLDGRGAEPVCRFIGAVDPGRIVALLNGMHGAVQQLEDEDARRPPLH